MAAIELMGRGFSTWEPHVNSSQVLRTLVLLTGLVTVTGSSSPIHLHSAAMLVARQAIIHISAVNPGLVISTLSFDLLHSKNASERSGCLKLMAMFFGKVISTFFLKKENLTK
jgi:hypothetical protein